MKIKKVKDSYNDYQLEISYSQLLAFKAGLESSPDPVSDETLAELDFYLKNLPGPGESEEELKQREEGTAGEGAPADGKGNPDETPEDDSVPIPMPPREGNDYRETTAGEGPAEGGGAEPSGGGEDELPEPPGHNRVARHAERGGGGRESARDEGPGLPEVGDEDEEALPSPPRE